VVNSEFLGEIWYCLSKKQTLPLDAPHDLPRFRVHNKLCVALYNGGWGGGVTTFPKCGAGLY